MYAENTDISGLDLATVVTDRLQDLLDLGHEAMVVDRSSQLDHTEMARTFSHILFTGVAAEVAIHRAKMRVIRTFLSRSEALLIHGL